VPVNDADLEVVLEGGAEVRVGVPAEDLGSW
jgi:hypothetical protein